MTSAKRGAKRFTPLIAAAMTLLLAACGNSVQIAPGIRAVADGTPPGPGEIRFGLKNPDPEKWTPRVQQAGRDGVLRQGFTCKVLACPEPASIVVTNGLARGPRPDQKALEKLAKESLPKLTQARNLELQVRSDNKAKIETLSSATSLFGEYNGILNETKVTVGDNVRHSAIAIVIAGRILVTINAEAGDRATARTAIDEFSRSFTVLEGPPL